MRHVASQWQWAPPWTSCVCCCLFHVRGRVFSIRLASHRGNSTLCVAIARCRCNRLHIKVVCSRTSSRDATVCNRGCTRMPKWRATRSRSLRCRASPVIAALRDPSLSTVAASCQRPCARCTSWHACRLLRLIPLRRCHSDSPLSRSWTSCHDLALPPRHFSGHRACQSSFGWSGRARFLR